MATIFFLNGPNLNLLGARETHYYGTETLDSINQRLSARCKSLGYGFQTLQSQSEAELLDAIHQASEQPIDFIVFNPAAFTHTSIALRDALLAVNIPFIELHLSNIYSREVFRQHSYFSDIALGSLNGFGPFGYEMALSAAINYLQSN